MGDAIAERAARFRELVVKGGFQHRGRSRMARALGMPYANVQTLERGAPPEKPEEFAAAVARLATECPWMDDPRAVAQWVLLLGDRPACMGGASNSSGAQDVRASLPARRESLRGLLLDFKRGLLDLEQAERVLAAMIPTDSGASSTALPAAA